MISVGVYLLLLGLFLPATAWAIARAARRVGSSRGRFGPAAAALAGLSVTALCLNVAADAVARGLAPAGAAVRSAAGPQGASSVTFSLLQLAIDFAVLRRTFRLSAGRTFAPLGAMVGAVAIELVIAWGLVGPYLTESFWLPTSGMSPTISAGDHITALKGVRPKRWDVVVYRSGRRGDGPTFCKRVVALPGERLTFDGNGGITINGVPVRPPPVVAGRYHAVPDGPGKPAAMYADGQAIVLTDQQVFVVGDDVDRSFDSRMQGPSPAAAVVGVVDLVYWPPGHFRLLR